MDKQEVIAELRRVAEFLQTNSLSITQFNQHGRISADTVARTFGSWNEAIEAAGLVSVLPGQNLVGHPRTIDDDDLLREIVRLTQELGKQPTQNQMTAKGRYSPGPYHDRWGSLAKACKVAYAKYGFPASRENVISADERTGQPASALNQLRVVIPQTHRPQESKQRKKVQFGEPIDFRGLRFAPVNEQGVVYIFGMVALELGFLIESIRTEYPDCEGKRSVDQRRQRWEHVRIEFEYQSSNFRQHGHNPDECDLIVCWIHDWEDSPLEVLELRSQIKYLPSR